MRRPHDFGLIVLLTLALAACGGGEAPKGRWEGYYQSQHWLVAVRLQVEKGNVIRSTALSVNVDGVSYSERVRLARRLKTTLLDQWPDAEPGKVDFDGDTMTRAGGYATLFKYDAKHHTMMFHFYAGGRLTERVKLYPVQHFAGA